VLVLPKVCFPIPEIPAVRENPLLDREIAAGGRSSRFSWKSKSDRVAKTLRGKRVEGGEYREGRTREATGREDFGVYAPGCPPSSPLPLSVPTSLSPLQSINAWTGFTFAVLKCLHHRKLKGRRHTGRGNTIRGSRMRPTRSSLPVIATTMRDTARWLPNFGRFCDACVRANARWNFTRIDRGYSRVLFNKLANACDCIERRLHSRREESSRHWPSIIPCLLFISVSIRPELGGTTRSDVLIANLSFPGVARRRDARWREIESRRARFNYSIARRTSIKPVAEPNGELMIAWAQPGKRSTPDDAKIKKKERGKGEEEGGPIKKATRAENSGISMAMLRLFTRSLLNEREWRERTRARICLPILLQILP